MTPDVYKNWRKDTVLHKSSWFGKFIGTLINFIFYENCIRISSWNSWIWAFNVIFLLRQGKVVVKYRVSIWCNYKELHSVLAKIDFCIARYSWICIDARVVISGGVLIKRITHTAWKVSVLGVFVVRIFPHVDWIQRFTP